LINEYGLIQTDATNDIVVYYFSSVKEQAFNFMWDGINWKKGGKYFANR
jgi:hypothetical protein